MPDPATDGDELREIARQLEIHAQSYHADTPNERVFMAMSRTILAAAKQLDSTRAIPVGERLPEDGQDVLAFGRSVNLWSSPGTVSNNEREWFAAGWGDGVWEVAYAESLQLVDVTHWQPLPAPPLPPKE